jgi:hypothetical protein
MRTTSIRLFFLAFLFTGLTFAQPQIGGGTCSTASLSGNYWVSATARVAPSGTFTAVAQTLDVLNFNGQGAFALTGIKNSTNGLGTAQQGNGTVTISSDCTGTLTAGGTNFHITVYNGGSTFDFAGSDSGGGTHTGTGGLLPSSCLTSTLSGAYAVNGNGFIIQLGNVAGIITLNGILDFDGAGKVNTNLILAYGTQQMASKQSGTYSVNTPSVCLGTLTLPGSNGGSTAVNFAITNQTGGDFQFISSGNGVIFEGSAHPVFHNPGQSVTNGASFLSGETAPGSIFSIFGENLGPNPGAFGSTLPLPTDVGATRVSVNGTDVPIFYAGTGQINAQMPVDVAPGLATVVVTNGNETSNAAAVYIPQAAPGIFTYGANNHALVINPHGQLNTEALPAHVGDTAVVYFTGGGAVTPSGPWTTGAAAQR